MAGTFISGPSIIGGPMFGAGAGQFPQEYCAEFGPSVDYQGDAIPDVRFPLNKDNPQPGSIPAHLNSPYFLMTDATPAASNTALTAAAAAASGTALANITASVAGATLNVPFATFGVGVIVANAIALDFGWGLIGVTSGSATATPAAGTMGLYSPGQWLVIGNVGNSGGTLPLITQVASVGTSTITLNASYLPSATNANAPVGSGNVFNANAGAQMVANAHLPYLGAGLVRLFDPKQSCSRGVGVTANAGATGGVVKITGYDVYGQLQTENVTAVAASTVWSRKTFKYFLSAVPQFTDAGHTYQVVTSDVFGFACRSDLFEYANIFYNGTYQTVQASTASMWVAADQTNPATSATGDVRGTVQVSARGANSATVTSTTYTNGTLRLAIFATVPAYNLISATPNNPTPLYGVTPA